MCLTEMTDGQETKRANVVNGACMEDVTETRIAAAPGEEKKDVKGREEGRMKARSQVQ